MSISMYDASVGVFIPAINTFLRLLDHGEAFARETGLAVEDLLSAALAPDMLPLSGQVQIGSNSAKMAVERLSGVESPRFEDGETTLDDLRVRLRAILAYFESVGPEQLEGSETRALSLSFGDWRPSFSGAAYLQSFAVPNVYFHLTTAYDILRHLGVSLGKRDFLGEVG